MFSLVFAIEDVIQACISATFNRVTINTLYDSLYCVKPMFADINLKVQSKAAELKISMGCRAKQPIRVCRTVTETGGGSKKWLCRFLK